MNERCSRCRDIGLQIEHVPGPISITSTAKWCDCPMAKRYIASLRQLGQSQAVLKYKLHKYKLHIIQRNAIERLTQLAIERDKPQNPR